MGLGFVKLKDWDQRQSPRPEGARAWSGRRWPLSRSSATPWPSPSRLPRSVSWETPPASTSSSRTGAGSGTINLWRPATSLLAMAAKNPDLMAVRAKRPGGHAAVQTRHRQRARLGALGLSLADVNDAISSTWGSSFVNDFIDRAGSRRCTSRRTPSSA